MEPPRPIIPSQPDSPTNGGTVSETLRQLDHLGGRHELRRVAELLADFNLFRVLRFDHAEIRHSNMLSWLLQPGESHGLKDAFLRRWLRRVQEDAVGTKVDWVNLDALSIRSVQVHREWSADGGFLDLLVRIQTSGEDEWIVAIENKVWSPESRGQLQGYREAVERAFPRAGKLYLFLSRREQAPADEAWLRANYGQMRDELGALLNEHAHSIRPEPAVLIRHYLEILKETSMSKDLIAELARKLYQDHQLALDAILEHRPDYLGELTTRLEMELQRDATALGLRPMLCEKGYVRFLPPQWVTPENLAGRAWGDSGSAYVLCEICLKDGDRPWFGMVESQGPEPWRNELWRMSGDENFPTAQRRTREPEQWMAMWSVIAGFKVGNRKMANTEVAAAKTWAWVKVVLGSDEFKTAVTRIASRFDLLPRRSLER